MKKVIKISIFIIFILSHNIIFSKEIHSGLSIQPDIGISPLLVINENSLGYRIKYNINDFLNLESTTAIGHSLLYLNFQLRQWFHFSQELGLGFYLKLGQTNNNYHILSIDPGIYLSFSPYLYTLYGPCLNIRYVIKNKNNNFIIEPINIFIRPLFRDTEFNYKWHFQTGFRFSFLWGTNEKK